MMKRTSQHWILGIGLLFVVVWMPAAVWGATSAVQIEARMQAARAEVQDAIRQAGLLADAGQYAEALRLLFDALSTEQETQLMLAVLSEAAGGRDLDELFPITAGKAMKQLERRVIHEDQSPLMRWFRTPDIPLREKFATLAALRALATERGQTGSDVPFLGQYRGTLVQLMRSPVLDGGEKRDFARELRYAIQTEYTSGEEQDRMREAIVLLRDEAEQAFQTRQYVEALVLISDAGRQARKMRLFAISRQEDDSLTELEIRIEKTLVAEDDSPLMQAFKNRDIPTRTRQFMVYDLKNMLGAFQRGTKNTITLDGTTYTGTLVDVLTHPDIDWLTKDGILNNIEWKFLKTEPDWVPEYLLGIDR